MSWASFWYSSGGRLAENTGAARNSASAIRQAIFDMRNEYTPQRSHCVKMMAGYRSSGRGAGMLKAEKTTVTWDADKKQWHVRVQIGEEVIKRPLKSSHEASEDDLRSRAVQIAKDEGYEVDASKIAVQR